MTPERSCQPCLTVDQAARRDGLLTLLRLRAAITIKGDLADQAAALGRPLPPGCDLTVQERRHAEVMVNDPATVGAQLVELSALLAAEGQDLEAVAERVVLEMRRSLAAPLAVEVERQRRMRGPRRVSPSYAMERRFEKERRRREREAQRHVAHT